MKREKQKDSTSARLTTVLYAAALSQIPHPSVPNNLLFSLSLPMSSGATGLRVTEHADNVSTSCALKTEDWVQEM